MRRTINFFLTLILSLYPIVSAAQADIVDLINSYGKLDRWSVREVKESGIIGGDTNHLYEFYGNQEIVRTKEPFVAPEGYLWRTNNAIAVVAGVTKTNTTVFPEKRGEGYCARLETHVESVKVMGMINMDVTCQGAFFIGSLEEPIRDTKSPMAKVMYGLPFEGRPQSLSFDYKAEVGHDVVRGTGFSRLKEMDYADYPKACLILQKRWEEADGSVHALRVGTAIRLFEENAPEWVNGFKMNVAYGDITTEPFYRDYMGLIDDPETSFYCENSLGKKVMVQEEGWADEGDEPNYLILTFLASSQPAFYGGVGNILWLDNIRLEME